MLEVMPTFVRVEAGGKSAMLGPNEFVIGRSVYCTLAVDDPSVSRLHASLRKVGDDCEIVDLGSSNGTFVNGKKVVGDKPRKVTPQDEIKVGNLVVRLVVVREVSRDRMVTESAAPGSGDEPTGSFKKWPQAPKTKTSGRKRG